MSLATIQYVDYIGYQDIEDLSEGASLASLTAGFVRPGGAQFGPEDEFVESLSPEERSLYDMACRSVGL